MQCLFFFNYYCWWDSGGEDEGVRGFQKCRRSWNRHLLLLSLIMRPKLTHIVLWKHLIIIWICQGYTFTKTMTVWSTWVTWTQQHLQATGTPSSGQSVSSTQTLHSAFILCLTLGASDGKHSHLDHFRHACILIDNLSFPWSVSDLWLTDFYPRLLDFSYRFIIISFTSFVENIHFAAYPITPNVY